MYSAVKKPEQTQKPRNTQKHTERLNALVEDLLTLSRLEGRREQLDHEPVALGTLLREILASYRDAGVAPAVRFELNLEPGGLPVRVDVTRITQVFENLIDNALKYASHDPLIEIGARAVAGRVRVWMKDDGIGIPARDLPYIFERF